MSQTLEEMKQAADDLESVVQAGLMQTSVDGQSTTFANMRDLRSELAELRRQIQIAEEGVQTRPRWSSFDISGAM